VYISALRTAAHRAEKRFEAQTVGQGAIRRSYGYSLVGIAFLIVAIAVISSGGGTQ
jgi:hypothetical protein